MTSDSESREATYGDLFWPLVTSGGNIAQLNWATGVVGLDVDYEVYESSDKLAFDSDMELASVGFRHEQIHLLQICMTGFTYLWADTLFDLLRPIMSEFGRTELSGDMSGITRLIESGDQLLDDNVRDHLREHFRVLDEPNSWGLSMRGILETQAYVAERRFHGVVTSVSDLPPVLSAAPSSEYRAAYDLLSVVIGFESAYEWFDLIAGVSLCTSAPAESFKRIALGLARQPTELQNTPSRRNATERQRFLADFVSDELLGSAQQVAASQDPQNSFYVPYIAALNDAAGRGEIDPIWLLASPASEMMAVSSELTPIVFLRPRQPQGFSVSAPEMDEVEVLSRLAMASVSTMLTREIESETRRLTEDALERLDWLRGDRTPVMVQFDLDQVRNLDPAMLRIVDSAHPLAMPDDQLQYLWSRCLLMPPPELDPDGDLDIPASNEIRRYIHALHRDFAGFPLVLSWVPGTGAFFDWFGSLTEGDLDANGEMMVGPSTLAAIASASAAMYKLADEFQQNAGVLVDAMANQCPIESIE